MPISSTILATARNALLVGSLVLLVACDSPEDRAEKHYENAVALLDQGDRPRAYVEFRNALEQVPNHVATLTAFAEALQAEGNLGGAYRMHQRLAEAAPDQAEAQLSVALMAAELRDWDSARRYLEAGSRLAPEDARARLVTLALDYNARAQAAQAGPIDGVAEIERQARDLVTELPDSDLPHQILFDSQMRAGNDAGALAETELLIARRPDNPGYYQARLAILNRMGNREGLEAGLREMVERFPTNEQARGSLISFYMQSGKLAEAEAFLRSEIKAGVRDDGARQNLVAFLRQTRGNDAAREALAGFVTEGSNSDLFRTQLATMDFTDGARDQAIETLQEITAKDESSDQMRTIKITLAGMLDATGNKVGAQKIVDEVLAQDGSMVRALQLQAQMQIEADDPETAIVGLRRALNEEPSDAQTLTLLSEAYLRNGDRQLAGEALAQAAEAAGYRPPETLRYAQFLMQDQKWLPAEDVLLDALRRAPNTPQLLIVLGQIYLQMEDWPRAGQIERALREQNQPQLTAEADALHTRALQGQQRSADAVAFLEGSASADGGNIAAQVALLRTHLANGNFPAARSFLDSLLAQQPDNPIYRMLDPALKNAAGDHAGAEIGYRALVRDMPEAERVWIEYYRTLMAQDKRAEAEQALAEGLGVLPDGPDLNWIAAGNHERDGDPEGAIAIYEKLYAQQSGSSLLANNLASLLATARSDEDSLARAWNVARRLRDSDIPAFQDTYGWIAYRRGDLGEALRNLEPAAAGLPQDPSVQYHLGMLYAALPNRRADAERAFRAAVAVGGELDTAASRGFAQQAQTEIDRLKSGQ